MKILVADDSQTNLVLISAALNMLGHEVTAAKSGTEAISLFLKEKPDLIILDVHMEDTDGFECARKIREIEKDDWIPIIFLSGLVDDESIAKGIDAGGDDYLAKPFSQITLAAKIKAMQRISHMRNELYKATCQLSILSSTDALTGLYNRLQFNKTIAEEIAFSKRHNTMIGLLYLDLDNFKFINDHFGHHAGDLLLKEITKRLRTCMREFDFIARLGGDEFAILIKDINKKEDMGIIAKKILDIFSQTYYIVKQTFNIGCSIGIAAYPTDAVDADEFLRNADIAMYHAKALGRNNFQYFTDELCQAYNYQTQLKNSLKYAISQEEFYLRYDPVFNLQTKKLVGIEVLLRWQHEKYGEMIPKQFMSLTEEIGLTNAIDQWVLQHACAQGKKWLDEGFKDLTLSVNISPLQLLDKEFPMMIQQIVKVSGFPFNALELEVEIKDPLITIYTNLSEHIINQLSDLNIGIAIDDFGIGYSSLNSLKSMPIKTLKINRSFIEDVYLNEEDAMIVKSVITLGNDLNLKVIAEGIETKEQYEFLKNNHCLLGQGSFFSAVLNTDQMTKLLKESSGKG